MFSEHVSTWISLHDKLFIVHVMLDLLVAVWIELLGIVTVTSGLSTNTSIKHYIRIIKFVAPNCIF